MIHIGDFFYLRNGEEKAVVRDITEVAGTRYVTVRIYQAAGGGDDGEDSCMGCMSEDEMMEYREQVLRFGETRETITLETLRQALARA
ncbi:MAG: hypothetical protein LBD13_01855 [Spirochaetaceae bacterium]|jgi:hypothetical protein|nr:hypothetical protein [Spirochaetaceae bacterium]